MNNNQQSNLPLKKTPKDLEKRPVYIERLKRNLSRNGFTLIFLRVTKNNIDITYQIVCAHLNLYVCHPYVAEFSQCFLKRVYFMTQSVLVKLAAAG